MKLIAVGAGSALITLTIANPVVPGGIGLLGLLLVVSGIMFSLADEEARK